MPTSPARSCATVNSSHWPSSIDSDVIVIDSSPDAENPRGHAEPGDQFLALEQAYDVCNSASKLARKARLNIQAIQNETVKLKKLANDAGAFVAVADTLTEQEKTKKRKRLQMVDLHNGKIRCELGESDGRFDSLSKVHADALELRKRADEAAETYLIDKAIDRSCLQGALGMVSGLQTYVDALHEQAARAVSEAREASSRIKHVLAVTVSPAGGE